MRPPEPFLPEHSCNRCGRQFLNSAPLDDGGQCTACRVGATGFDRCYSYAEYDDKMRLLIHMFKYEGIDPLAAPLGRMLALALPRELSFDVLAPMPLHWRREWSRGFNQAELLAKELSARTGVPVVAHAVRRRKATPPQAALTAAARRKNVSGAFEAVRPQQIAGARVMLVDDVITTGATAAACARVFKAAGARQVSVLTVARADRRASVSIVGSRPA